MKVCTKCGKELPNASFYVQKGGKYGKRADCKECFEKAKQESKERKGLNLPSLKTRIHPPKESKDFSKSINLKTNYGINITFYNKMLKNQGERCLICRRHQSELKRGLAVDHCHKTGKVRGLLCIDCNLGLGAFKDNKDLLMDAIAYLSWS